MNQIQGLDVNSFFKFAADTFDTQANFDLQKELIKSPNRMQSLSYLMKSCQNSPEFLSLFNDKYMKRFPTTAELLDMPDQTLGHHLGLHLKTNNIQLDFAGVDSNVFYNQEMTLPVYLGLRALRNHDVLHVLLGKDVSPLSEFYVFAFQIAQFQSPLHMISLSAGMLGSILCNVIDPIVFMNNLTEAFQRGQKAKFVFGFPLEDHWLTPIADVRRLVGV